MVIRHVLFGYKDKNLDKDEKCWRTSTASSPSFSSSLGNRIFIIGGKNKSYGPSLNCPTNVDYYDTVTYKWYRLKLEPPIPEGRYGVTTLAIGKEIICVGGHRQGKYDNTIITLDTEYKPIVTITGTFREDMKSLLNNDAFSDINFRVQNRYIRGMSFGRS